MTTVQQYAEAASQDLWKRLVDESLPFNRLTREEKKAVMLGIVARHMQAAVDEEVALLRGTIAAQDERERLAGERCGVPYHEHGCDWPEWVANQVLNLRERIAELLDREAGE